MPMTLEFDANDKRVSIVSLEISAFPPWSELSPNRNNAASRETRDTALLIR
ncbi:MAG: hypothetical protein AAGH89_15150 [Verrucomicrobiota bacterium]